MLSIFPNLLTYELVGPLLIRLALGAAFIWFGYEKIGKRYAHVKHTDKNDKKALRVLVCGIVDMVLGLLVLVGFLTQVAALLISIILIIGIGRKIKEGAFLTSGINYYVILLAMALSLLFTGAGFFAFDLPL